MAGGRRNQEASGEAAREKTRTCSTTPVEQAMVSFCDVEPFDTSAEDLTKAEFAPSSSSVGRCPT